MNSFPKYKRGDRVQTQHLTLKGTVNSSQKVDGIFEYKVKLDSGLTATYDEDKIQFSYEDLQEKTKPVIADKCPKCNNEWNVTKFGSRIWYDCITCGKTAEDLCSKTKEQYTSKKDDYDYDEDFGHFYPGYRKP